MIHDARRVTNFMMCKPNDREHVAQQLSESCGQIQFSSYASLPLTIRAKSISPAPITTA